MAKVLMHKTKGDPETNLRRARYYASQALAAEPENAEFQEFQGKIEERLTAIKTTEKLAQIEARAQEVLQRGDRNTAKALMASASIDRVLLAAEAGWSNEVQRAEAMQSWSDFVNAEHPPTVLVEKGAEWKYLEPLNPLPADDWMQSGFDHASWATGAAPLGFLNGETTTLENSLQNPRMAFYFRQSFTFDRRDAQLPHPTLILRLLRDDGAIVFLNGNEIVRSNMPLGEVGADTPAATNVSGATESQFFEFYLDGELLKEGENVIAVEVHQDKPGSSDIGFDMELALGEHSGRRLSELAAKGNPQQRFLFAPEETVALGAASLIDLEKRARVQWVLGDYESVLACLDALTASSANAPDPADVLRREDWLQRKASALEALGRLDEAAAVRSQVTGIGVEER
jgi:hypothetical protein